MVLGFGFGGADRYMAPEVFRHEKYDSAVDVYSFAIIFYEVGGGGGGQFAASIVREGSQKKKKKKGKRKQGEMNGLAHREYAKEA